MPQRASFATPALAAVLGVLAVLGSACGPELSRFEFERPELGTTFRLVLYAQDEAGAAAAAEAAFGRVEELDAILSDYREDSELAELCRRGADAPFHASPELFAVLARAEQLSARTDGTFDVTVGPLTALWRRARDTGKLPDPAELAAARARVGWRKVVLDEADRSVELRERGMRLDLGGIAKGYVLDEVLRVLRERGVEHALVDGGGDVACGAPPPGREAWRVEVEIEGSDVEGSDVESSERLEVAHRVVCTSGDRNQAVEIGGVRYSHVVDPRTGLGVTVPRQATVVAADGMTADALATALCVLGGERGAKLIALQDNVDGWVLD